MVTVLVPCTCGEKFSKEISPDVFKNAPSGIASIFVVHKDHAIILYVDPEFRVRGVEPVTVEEADKKSFVETGAIPLEYRIVPVKKKFPPMLIELGLINATEVKVLNAIDGRSSLVDIARAVGMTLEETRKIINALTEKKLVSIKHL
ncbi:MAG: hypothetical protein QXL15_00275 [Candidatus Korarchaeota archaeon]